MLPLPCCLLSIRETVAPFLQMLRGLQPDS